MTKCPSHCFQIIIIKKKSKFESIDDIYWAINTTVYYKVNILNIMNINQIAFGGL